MICAVGQELRDYPTLVEAVRDLDLDVAIAAASPWSKRADSSAGLDVPANVTARGYDLFELRQLYADSAFVVVPLQETDFQAGITTILEAMSMEQAIVCTRTTGQTDTIVDGDHRPSTSRPAMPAALRAAIQAFLADPAEAAASRRHGRRWVAEHADIARYADSLAALTRAGLHRRRSREPGTPATTVSAATESVTTAPAPTTAPRPIVTPGMIDRPRRRARRRLRCARAQPVT